jgi:glycosyltransferase involved in cell wall biosynthesis
LKKTITVAIPIYERSDYFDQALSSVLNQTVLPDRILVVDDASSHTGFRDRVARLNNPLVTYYRNEVNLNLGGNFNQCIKHCTTDFLTILHDDDLLHPQFVEYFYKCLESKKGENIDAIVFGAQVGQEPDFSQPVSFTPPRERITRKTFLFGNITPFPGVVFRPNPTILFDRNHYPAEDIFFWYSLVHHNYSFYRVPTPLTFYRVSPAQMSSWAYKNIIAKVAEFMETCVVTTWNPAERIVVWHTLRRIDHHYRQYDTTAYPPPPSLAFFLSSLFSRAYKKLIVDVFY